MGSSLAPEKIAPLVQLVRNEKVLLDSDLAELYEVTTGRLNEAVKRNLDRVAMLSSVLRSPRAVEVNIAIMRTFVQLRKLMDSNRDLAKNIEDLERKYAEHDHQFQIVFEAIKRLIESDAEAKSVPNRRIGFHVDL